MMINRHLAVACNFSDQFAIACSFCLPYYFTIWQIVEKNYTCAHNLQNIYTMKRVQSKILNNALKCVLVLLVISLSHRLPVNVLFISTNALHIAHAWLGCVICYYCCCYMIFGLCRVFTERRTDIATLQSVDIEIPILLVVPSPVTELQTAVNIHY